MSVRPHDRHHRRSVRLASWDYTQAGAYFVTICVHGHECMFGQVVDGQMALNQYGRTVEEEWHRTALLRPYVKLDVHATMPNHFHGIIWITTESPSQDEALPGPPGDPSLPNRRGEALPGPPGDPGLPSRGEAPPRPYRGRGVAAGSLGAIVGQFKSAVTRRINSKRGTPGARVWQRNYYEHIVRSQRALDAIRQYIVNNPARWALDRYNPDTSGPDPQATELWRLLRADG